MSQYVQYFNQSPIKSLATVDAKGSPNVCFCGSAVMVDENTIQALSGYFDRTLANLNDNSKAVFLAQKPTTMEYYAHFEKTGELLFPAGFRYYCTLTGQTRDEKAIAPLKSRLQAIAGSRIAGRINLLLTFKVEEIREVIIKFD